MKRLGLFVVGIGTVAVVLYPPLEFFGIGVGRDFILADQGFGIRSYSLIDTGRLLLELVIANGIGIGLYFLGKKREEGR